MKKTIALLASLSVLSTMPTSFASALFFEDTYKYFEITEDQIEKYGYTMYSLDKTYKTGKYEKEGSYFDSCDLYHNHYESEYDFIVENEYYRDTKELIDRDYIVVPAEKIESFCHNVTVNSYKFIMKPELYDVKINLNTTKSFYGETYEVDLYKSNGMKCKVVSNSDASPIDFDKLNEIAPEIKHEISKSKTTEQGYEFSYNFYTEHQLYDINGTLLTFKRYTLDEETRDKILACASDHMISFRSSHSYDIYRFFVDEHHSVEHENVEKAKVIYDKYGISFTIPGYDESYNIIDEEAAGEKAVLIPDEPIEGIVFFEILCEFADEGIATTAQPKEDMEALYYNEPEVELVANVKGDANNDGNLALSDSIAILQTVGNPDEYRLSAQGKYNADIAGDFDGITNLDALTVQRKLLKLE